MSIPIFVFLQKKEKPSRRRRFFDRIGFSHFKSFERSTAGRAGFVGGLILATAVLAFDKRRFGI